MLATDSRKESGSKAGKLRRIVILSEWLNYISRRLLQFSARIETRVGAGGSPRRLCKTSADHIEITGLF